MHVTLQELAKAAGVSASTVSRALTPGKHPVNEETRQKILTLAERLDYRPNLVARGLRTERTHTLGIVVDNIVSPFTPTIIRGIQDYLQEHHYFSLIINTDWDPDSESKAIRELLSRSIDGVILVESFMRGPHPVLDVTRKPYVYVHRLSTRSDRNSVMVDDVYGSHLAVEHLAGLGHRRIAYINGPQGWAASANRYTGYVEELSRWGLTHEPSLVEQGDWELQSGFAATRRFLALEKPPTAIFAANDLMALGAIYAVQEAGLRVPEDIAVVGYDNREIAGLVRPPITTISLPCYEMGQASAALLLRLLGAQSPPAEPVMLRGRLIVRESSGAPDGKIPLERYRSHTTARRPVNDGEQESMVGLITPNRASSADGSRTTRRQDQEES
ncbi:MAG: LacI family DNA-binding transcriptional regulator [Chloroflexia bacterium]